MKTVNKQKLLEELTRYHQAKDYKKIIDTIELLPKNLWDYDLIGLLARAYENLAQIEDVFLLEKAIALLMMIKEAGKTDPNWYFRMGYALFYLNRQKEAKPYFLKIFELIGRAQKQRRAWKIAKDFLLYCDAAIEYEKNLQVYTGEEATALKNHIEKYFGKIAYVLHEVISANIRVDICVIEPTRRKNYYKLVTMGMGAHKMNVPDDMKDENLDRAELVMYLPTNWNFQDMDEKWYWPMRWMRILTRLPINQHSWVGWGHSIGNDDDEPFAPNVGFSAMMTTSLLDCQQKANYCRLPNGGDINFYNLLPLYAEELEYKCQYDAERLLMLFRYEGIKLPTVDFQRPNVAKGHLKKFVKKARDLKLLLKNWVGADKCVISDRITVDGQKVGYFYREEPHGDWDSGWRFLAGDETKEDCENPEKGDVYHLNTICNYDSDVMPLLKSPIGSSFMRNDDGKFVLCYDKESSKNIVLLN